MENGGQVVWHLDADSSGFDRKVGDANRKVSDLADEMNNADRRGTRSFSNLGESVQHLGSNIVDTAREIGRIGFNLLETGAIGAAGALVTLGVKGITSANQLQALQLSMDGLTKSMTLGAQAMAGAYEYAQKSPFQLPDVAGSVKTLLAFGMSVNDSVAALETLGNVSITTGLPIQNLAAIFGEVSAQGKLTNGVITQLTQDGVSILPALQKQFGLTAQQVRDMADKGQISFAQFKTAMESIVDPHILDLLNNTLPRQLDRLGGSVRKLSNAFVGVNVDATNGFTMAANGIDQAATNLVKTLADTLRSPAVLAAATAVGNAVVPLINAAAKLIVPLVDGFASLATHISEVGAIAFPVLGLMVAGFGGLATQIPILGQYFGFLAGPIGIIAGVLAGIVSASPELRTGLLAAFKEVGATLKTLQPTLSVVGGLFTQIASSIGKALVPVVKALGDLLSSVLTAVAPLIPVFMNLVVVLVNSLAPILTAVATTLSQTLAPVIGTVARLFVTLMQAIAPLVPVVVGIAATLITALAPIFAQLATTIGPILVQTLIALTPALVSIAQSLAIILPPVAQLVVLFVQLAAWVAEVAAKFIAGLVPVLVPVAKGIAAIVTGLTDFGVWVKHTLQSIDLTTGEFKFLKATTEGLVVAIVAGVAAYKTWVAIQKTVAAVMAVTRALYFSSAPAIAVYTAFMSAETVATGAAAAATTALDIALGFLLSPIVLIIGAIGAVVAVVYELIKHFTWVKNLAADVGSFFGIAKKGADDAKDSLDGLGGSAGDLQVKMSSIDLNGAGTLSGATFTTGFAKTLPEITSGLTNAVQIDPQPMSVSIAEALTKAFREAKFSDAIIDALNPQKIIDTATQSVRDYTLTWATGIKNSGISGAATDEIIKLGQNMKADAGLTGAAAGQNIADKLKLALIKEGVAPSFAAELAKGAPAAKLAAGTLGADVTDNFNNAIKQYLISQHVPEDVANSFLSHSDILKNAMTDIAKQGGTAFGVSFEDVMKNPGFTGTNVLIASMSDTPVKMQALGISAAIGFQQGFTGAIQSGTPQLGGGLATAIQSAGSTQNATANVQGSALGTTLINGTITGVTTAIPQLGLTIGSAINGATTLHVGTAQNQGNLLGNNVSSGLQTGVANGTLGIQNSIGSTIGSATNGNLNQANVNGQLMGTNIGLGAQTGVTQSAGGLQTATQGMVNGGIKINTAGATDIGKGIVSGAAKGVEDNKKSLWDKVGDMAGGAVKWAKNLLGIHSPSTVFAEMGMNIALGLGGGIDSYGSVAIGAVTDLASQITDVASGIGDSFPTSLGGNIDVGVNNKGYEPVVGNLNPNDISGASQTTTVENHIGTITIGSEVDGENWLQKLTRQDEVTQTGLTSNV